MFISSLKEEIQKEVIKAKPDDLQEVVDVTMLMKANVLPNLLPPDHPFLNLLHIVG